MFAALPARLRDVNSIEWMQRTLLLVLTAYSILWRGGKSVDATWILSLTTCAIVLLNVLYNGRRGKEQAIVHPWTWLLIASFVLWTVLSYLSSTAKNYGLDEVMQTVSASLIFFWSVRWFREHRAEERRVLKMIAATTLVACAIGIMVYMFQPVTRMVGSFFDTRFHTDYWPNAWAEFVILAWPVVLYSLLGEKKLQSISVPCFMSIILACLLLSYSRGAVLSLAVQLMFFGTLIIPFIWKIKPMKKVTLMAGGTLIIALMLCLSINHLRGQFFPVESVIRKATFTASEGTSSVSERSQFWQQAIVLTMQRPLVGWGPYSFRFTQPSLQTQILATADHPHNVILKLSSERGIPAAVILIMIILVVAGSGVRALMRSKDDSNDRLLIALLMTSLTGVFIHNLIDYNLQFVGILLPTILIAAIIISRTSQSKPHRYVVALRAIEVVVAACLLALTVREGYALALSSIGRNAASKTRGEFPLALEYYKRAEWQLFSRDMYLSAAHLSLHLGKDSDYWTSLYLARNDRDARVYSLLAAQALSCGDAGSSLRLATKAYEYGKYNDVTTLYSLVQASVMQTPSTLPLIRHDIDELIEQFARAIESNTHFVALSSNVEALASLCTLMERYVPENGTFYASIRERIDRASRKERQSLRSRPDGVLW